MIKRKVKRAFYSITEAARLSGCTNSEMIYFGANNKLPIYAVIAGLRLQKYEPTNFPDDDDRFPNDLTCDSPVLLWETTLAEIAGRGFAYCPVVDRVDHATGEACTYEVFSDKSGVLKASVEVVTPDQLVIFAPDVQKYAHLFVPYVPPWAQIVPPSSSK